MEHMGYIFQAPNRQQGSAISRPPPGFDKHLPPTGMLCHVRSYLDLRPKKVAVFNAGWWGKSEQVINFINLRATFSRVPRDFEG